MRVIFIAFPDNLTTLLYLFLCYCHGFQCYSQSRQDACVIWPSGNILYKKKVNNDPQEYLFQWGEISYAEFQ